MGRVFVVQEPMKSSGARVLDLSPALKYGEMVFLVPSGTFVKDWSGIVQKMRIKLQDFSDDDFLLPTGHPIAIAIAGALASAANEGRVRFLRWHPKLDQGRGGYELSRVEVWDGLDISGAPVIGSAAH